MHPFRRAAVALCLLVAAPAVADAPAILLTHHGRLLDADDKPVTASVEFTFRIYAEAQKPVGVDETAIWSEKYTVDIHAGAYAVVLGNTEGSRKKLTGADLPAGANRFLSVQVGTAAELSPRLRISAVPYALNASRADSAAHADVAAAADLADEADHAAEADHALDADKIGGKGWADRVTELDGRFAALASGVRLQGTSPTAQAGTISVDGRLIGAKVEAPEAALGTLTASGNVTAGSFTGEGSAITALNATQLTSGVVPGDRISGKYEQKLDLPNTGNTFKGAFDGAHTGTFSGTHTGTFSGGFNGTFTGTFSGTSLTLPLADTAPACGSAERGNLYLNRTDGQVYLCDGGWKPTSQRARLEGTRLSEFDTEGAPRLVVELRNSGETAAKSLVITVGSGFTQTNDCGTALAAGGLCRITVTITAGQTNEAAIAGDLSASSSTATTISLPLAARINERDTCYSYKLAGAASDGQYWIDPDGLGGAAPVNVYCDMTTDGGGYTLVGYCGTSPDVTTSKGENFRDLKCGGGTYNAAVRTSCASLPSAAIARRSRAIAFTRSASANQVGNMNAYAVIQKFNIPDPRNVTFDNHSAFAQYTNDAADHGPCVPVMLYVLKGPTAQNQTVRYTFANSLGTTWHGDAYPTGYGAVSSPACESAASSLGPMLASVHSGAGNRNNNDANWTKYENACVTNGRGNYIYQGWWDADAKNLTGSAAIWLK